MKKSIFTLCVIVGTLVVNLFGQNIEITFTGDNNGQLVQLDSVYIENLTQGGEVILYPPDLTLILVMTGIEDEMTKESTAFRLQQNYPNPFNDQTSFQLQISETTQVEMIISNLLGQNLLSSKRVMCAGTHTFSFTPGNEKCYFFTASCDGHTKTIKMLCNHGSKKQSISLSYSGQKVPYPSFKTLQLLGELPFELGDELLMIAYSELGESGMVKSPEMSQECIMQFATNVSCPGLDSLLYFDQWYHTIQVGGQCWMKENLNVGEMIIGNQTQTNNDTIEKYCPLNNEYYCNIFSGGLYQWSEMMNYANETGAQGICPDGWHIPTDFEWQVLEGAVDGIYGIGDSEWENTDWRGSDVGGNLKQTGTEWWESPNTGATDSFGFAALPGGYFVQDEYWGGGWKGYFWSSDIEEHFFRNMDYNEVMVRKDNGFGPGFAISVRCLKDLD